MLLAHIQHVAIASICHNTYRKYYPLAYLYERLYGFDSEKINDNERDTRKNHMPGQSFHINTHKEENTTKTTTVTATKTCYS